MLNWPVPPHYELVDEPVEETGRAVVVLKDNERLSGRVTHFDAKHCLLGFQPDNDRPALSLGATQFKTLRLTDPVILQRDHMELAGTDSGHALPDNDMQRCIVRFKDGEVLESNTAGYVIETSGIFLYLPSYGNKRIRWFIPGSAIESYQIGDRLGKSLVEDNLVSPSVLEEGLARQQALRSRKLGEYLTERKAITGEDIEAALIRNKNSPPRMLGEVLTKEGLISQQQLDEALARQASDRRLQLGEILIQMGAVDRQTVRRMLTQKLGIPNVDLSRFRFDPELARVVPESLARRLNALPLYRKGNRLLVAMDDPLSSDILNQLAFATHLRIEPVMAAYAEIEERISQFYRLHGKRESVAELVQEMHLPVEPEMEDAAEPGVSESDNAVVRLASKIILDAYEQGASDIHIEAMAGSRPTRVRFRKDGAMVPYAEIPSRFRRALVSRIKIMSKLDISERRHSQDGKIGFSQFGPVNVELRVVTIPTTDGLEDVVMRILTHPQPRNLDQLGVPPRSLAVLKSLSERDHGLCLSCGPTGSGKTTTLHAILGHLNNSHTKIWTVEDPVEITQEGLRQVQVQARADWDFASVLRSLLRADPDVIMVGETRDSETADTVLEASLTGHMVFSTMHTGSAVESIARLLDLGVDSYNLADALVYILGQRLVRRLCGTCRSPVTASDEDLDRLASEYARDGGIDKEAAADLFRARYTGQDGSIRLYRAAGCTECADSGYKGRVGLYELMTVDPDIKKLIGARRDLETIRTAVMQAGMHSMRQHGIEKVFEGETDWDQVRRI